MKRATYFVLGICAAIVLSISVNSLVYPPMAHDFVAAKMMENRAKDRGENPPLLSERMPRFDYGWGVRRIETYARIGSALVLAFCITQLIREERKRSNIMLLIIALSFAGCGRPGDGHENGNDKAEWSILQNLLTSA